MRRTIKWPGLQREGLEREIGEGILERERGRRERERKKIVYERKTGA